MPSDDEILTHYRHAAPWWVVDWDEDRAQKESGLLIGQAQAQELESRIGAGDAALSAKHVPMGFTSWSAKELDRLNAEGGFASAIPAIAGRGGSFPPARQKGTPATQVAPLKDVDEHHADAFEPLVFGDNVEPLFGRIPDVGERGLIVRGTRFGTLKNNIWITLEPARKRPPAEEEFIIQHRDAGDGSRIGDYSTLGHDPTGDSDIRGPSHNSFKIQGGVTDGIRNYCRGGRFKTADEILRGEEPGGAKDTDQERDPPLPDEPTWWWYLNATVHPGDGSGHFPTTFRDYDALGSHEVYGPLKPSAKKHEYVLTDTGRSLRAMAIDTKAYFTEDFSNVFSGPLDFELALYPDVGEGLFPVKTHLQMDLRRLHDFLCGPRIGIWAWFTRIRWAPPITCKPTRKRETAPSGDAAPGPGNAPFNTNPLQPLGAGERFYPDQPRSWTPDEIQIPSEYGQPRPCIQKGPPETDDPRDTVTGDDPGPADGEPDPRETIAPPTGPGGDPPGDPGEPGPPGGPGQPPPPESPPDRPPGEPPGPPPPEGCGGPVTGDNRQMRREFGYDLLEAMKQPLVAHSVYLPTFEQLENPTASADGETCPTEKTWAAQLEGHGLGGDNPRIDVFHPATGPGSKGFGPPEMEAYHHLTTFKSSWFRKFSNPTWYVMAGQHTFGSGEKVTIDGRMGMGLRYPTERSIASGFEFALDFSGDGGDTTPDVCLNAKDATGTADPLGAAKLKIGHRLQTNAGRIKAAFISIGSFTLDPTHHVVKINGAHTVTLPASVTGGLEYELINNHSAAVTINRNGNNINGAASNYTLQPGDRASIIGDPDTTGWCLTVSSPTGAEGDQAFAYYMGARG